MSNKDSDRDTLTGFFRDSAAGISGFLGKNKDPERVLSFEGTSTLPQLPKTSPAPEAQQKAYGRTLRAFFRTGKGGGLPLSDGQLKCFPALLAPFRGKEYLQYDFPCWVADAESVEKEANAGAGFYTLQSLLQQAVEKIAPQDGQAIILKDNLQRLEAGIREKVSLVDAAFKAAPVFEDALRELGARLSVKGEEGKALDEGLLRLKKALPQSGVLIPFSVHAPLHLLATVIQRKLAASRQPVKKALVHLVNQLNDILAVEREKSPESHSAEQLHSALDFADSFLNFEELSSVLPSGGSDAMPEERYHRIEMVLDCLKQGDELLFKSDAFVVLDQEQEVFRDVDWTHNFSRFNIHRTATGKLSSTAAEVFDKELGKAARFFAAMRIGELEVNNQYFPEIHSDFFTHFDWRNFNEPELAACAPVLLLSEAEALLEKEFNAFSHQLAAGRPIKYFAVSNRDHTSERDHNPPMGSLAFRRELGALAIAHRNAFVLQASAIRPDYLNDGFVKGVGAFSPALFHLLSAPSENDIAAEPSLWLSAAVEGREFPGFSFDSGKGPKWGSRFDIHENPQPEADWPVHQLAIVNEEGKEVTLALPFTFADFAVLEAPFNHCFNIVPPEYWGEGITPLADYLECSGEAVYTKVPFVWLVDERGLLQRAAVAWALVLACRERLDHWHYLQENAGIHSYHVEQATERLSRQLQEAMEKKIAVLRADHLAELEKAKEESARNAMERLASVLLEMDVDGIVEETSTPEEVPAPKPVPEPVTPPAEQKAPAPKEKEESEPEEDGLGEAWIETPLCTSCNECIEANQKIFKYNADKQAIVADPRGGPFADIVRAAEKCPVKIIHPGAPQNPKEEGLEEWVKRAEPLQG